MNTHQTSSPRARYNLLALACASLLTAPMCLPAATLYGNASVQATNSSMTTGTGLFTVMCWFRISLPSGVTLDDNMDTDPTDRNSYLRITSAQISTNGVQINWSGGSQARQYLQRISSIGGTDTWVNVQTAQPPTALTGTFLDTAMTNGASFYRIRVERP